MRDLVLAGVAAASIRAKAPLDLVPVFVLVREDVGDLLLVLDDVRVLLRVIDDVDVLVPVTDDVGVFVLERVTGGDMLGVLLWVGVRVGVMGTHDPQSDA